MPPETTLPFHRDSCVVSEMIVSFTTEDIKVKLKPMNKRSAEISVVVKAGQFYSLTQAVRYYFQHQIEPVDKGKARLGVTFRYTLKDMVRCLDPSCERDDDVKPGDIVVSRWSPEPLTYPSVYPAKVLSVEQPSSACDDNCYKLEFLPTYHMAQTLQACVKRADIVRQSTGWFISDHTLQGNIMHHCIAWCQQQAHSSGNTQHIEVKAEPTQSETAGVHLEGAATYIEESPAASTHQSHSVAQELDVGQDPSVEPSIAQELDSAPTSIENWSIPDVQGWLLDIGLGHFRAAFEEHAIVVVILGRGTS